MQRSPLHHRLALAGIVLVALVLRVRPLVDYGPWSVPTDYDEGVYFTAGALLLRGELPYRDFVFVHPPGLPLFFAATSGLWGLHDVAGSYLLARFLAALVGAGCVLLVARLATLARGPAAGLLAALTYAVFPEAVAAERGAFLEPVLNLWTLLFASCWLFPERPALRIRRLALRTTLSGVTLALAGLTKFTSVALLPSALLSRARHPEGPRLSRVLVSAALVGAALALPFLVASKGDVVAQTLLFHLRRPPDGEPSAWLRLWEISGGRHAPLLLLVLLGVGRALPRLRTDAYARFWLTHALCTGGLFLASSSYWSQYNAALAPSLACLAGLAVAPAGSVASGSPWPRRVSIAATALLLALCAHRAQLESRKRDVLRAGNMRLLGGELAGRSVFAFEPAWLLSAGRLPALGTPGTRPSLAVDTYAGRLFLEHVRRPPVDAQRRTLDELLQADCAMTGYRGKVQLTAESWEELRRSHRQVFPREGERGDDVWCRVGRDGEGRPPEGASAAGGGGAANGAVEPRVPQPPSRALR